MTSGGAYAARVCLALCLCALCLGAAGMAGFPVSAVGETVAAPPPHPRSFKDCPDCPEMVVVPAGRFEMGASAEELAAEGVPEKFARRELPRHAVAIARPFALGRTDVTRGLYARFVVETLRPDPPGCMVYDPKSDSWPYTPGYSWRRPDFAQTDDHPAVCVSWNDATAFAAWLSAKTGRHYRLPSEAEWEYAARGGTTTVRYWGDSGESVCAKVNSMTVATVRALGFPASWKHKLVCDDEERSFTVPVASFEPNPFGLYDMLGNAWEWVRDCAHDDFNGAPTDGSAWMSGPCAGRVVKGGAYHSAPWLVRPATRGLDIHPTGPDGAANASGFRVARDMD
jgi:formylglycine-generating enzyme required for sulfatase activity